MRATCLRARRPCGSAYNPPEASMTLDPLALSAHPHRRFNPLMREWVLVSPHRTERPWQGRVEPAAPAHVPAYDPTCYLCPGNARAGGARNPDYAGTFVFDNDYAALLPDTPPGSLDERGLLVAEAESGVCRVVCFSPRHDLTLATLDAAARRRVVDTWTDEYRALGARPGVGYVQIFENRGEMMGASNPHPHGQIWATATVPDLAAREQASLEAYAAAHGRLPALRVRRARARARASGSCARTTRSPPSCRSGRSGPSSSSS